MPEPRAIDRAAHRALVEAGYAPLREYVELHGERFEVIECGGCAPPVLAADRG
jgi:hypothetical protein